MYHCIGYLTDAKVVTVRELVERPMMLLGEKGRISKLSLGCGMD